VKYSFIDDFAIPISKRPITSTYLLDHFFTKYLIDRSFKLGAEDITDVKLLLLQSLESLIKDLQEGYVKFVETGIPFDM